MSEYHVAYGPLSQEIHVGRVSKTEPVFLEKQARTDEVIAVVGEYAREAFGDGKSGWMQATYEGLNMRITVKVEALNAPTASKETPDE